MKKTFNSRETLILIEAINIANDADREDADWYAAELQTIKRQLIKTEQYEKCMHLLDLEKEIGYTIEV